MTKADTPGRSHLSFAKNTQLGSVHFRIKTTKEATMNARLTSAAIAPSVGTIMCLQ